MKVIFLGQGFTEESPNSVGVHINKYLADQAFTSFYGISAFASPLGIKLLDSLEQAKKSYTTLNIIVGVDQSGTSKEALEEILKLEINSFVFYQQESPIFHPKIYLFEGKDDTCLIIGSSNLTGKGLFSNIESSILIQFKNDDQEGLKVLEDLKNYFRPLFDLNEPNLFKLDDKLISNLEKDGIIPTEAKRSKQHGKQKSSTGSKGKRSLDIPKRPTSKLPWAKLPVKSIFPVDVTSSIEGLEVAGVLEDNEEPKLELLWESGPLTERDLNIPSGSNTKPTGSMLFKKAEMDVDQRHYFRDQIFNGLEWIADANPKTAHIERSSAFFQLIVQGNNHGIFELFLNHDTNQDSKSYKQSQPMTNVRWGSAKKIIAKSELIGLSAKLYRSSTPDVFLLKIG